MSLWYTARLTTYLDLASALRFKDLVRLQVKSYISDRLIIELQHLASYVSCHNAMAYDMNPCHLRGKQLHHGSGDCWMLMWFVAFQPYCSHVNKPMGREFFVPAGTA
jgi:hypothetical protein